MTDNELRHPPTLIEPDSDDEGPRRKRLRADEKSSPTDHDGLAILQAALLLVVAAAELKTANQNLFFYDVSSHQTSSYLRDHEKSALHSRNPTVSSFAAAHQIEATSSSSTCTPTASHDCMMPSQLLCELSQTDKKRRIRNPMAPGTTTHVVTTKVFSAHLPSGKPLLAPPPLPHLKCGECFGRPSPKDFPPSIKNEAVRGSGKA